MPYIYKITNQINGKIYIGKTYNSIESRFKEHVRDSKRQRNEKRPLYVAINKYGSENFSLELIEETNEPEEREKFWIEYFQSYKNGYNATTGGDGRPYADYDLIFSLYKNENKSYREIKELTGYDSKTIRTALELHNISKQDRKQMGNQKISHPVAKLDKTTEEILEIYSSVIEAEKANNIQQHIGQVCKGKRKTAGGYKWKYL